ncbi:MULTISPECIES: hypothetical protein [unclassified Chelatococcus]|uniref:phage tail assembly chaperone n=1 Tax=unclassified Chelatococcus TaxID=2638111 RepID=UPI001BCF138A|nr:MULTISPECIES: hypothetical protein [unclassified Chelatococcus]MBS7741439.1 hypothetical protein [Chelatococcus sp. HY11]MBX3544541.1 hypothetical protein [Chelatococcus sp.]MCO5078937.1 hypothetical protein [Chelatococcus sp.]
MLPPDLDLLEADLLEAFNELGTDRPVGFGVGPIPFSSIDSYASRYGYDDAEGFELLRRAIRLMDAVYLAAVNKQQPSEARR